MNNVVSAVTAYWLEEGPARWFEMSGSTCAVVASILFARPGKARTALGAIMSAGDLAGCIGVTTYTAGKTTFCSPVFLGGGGICEVVNVIC